MGRWGGGEGELQASMSASTVMMLPTMVLRCACACICRCPSLARTVGMGALRFLVTVLLTMVTAFTTFTEEHDDGGAGGAHGAVGGVGVGVSEVLQTLIRHMQVRHTCACMHADGGASDSEFSHAGRSLPRQGASI